MMYIYSSKVATKKIPDRDVVDELCIKEGTSDIEKALIQNGYRKELYVGNESAAEIELYFSSADAEYGVIALVALGGRIETYAMASFHDALEFMREYAPTVKAVCDLRLMDAELSKIA